MIEFKRNGAFAHEHPDESERLVKIVGIGGAGTNVIDRIILDSNSSENIVCLETDQQPYAASVSNHRVLMGKAVLHGLGAGGDPEVCSTLVDDEIDEIHKTFQGVQVAVLVCGLGGGTGSAVTPALTVCLREMGVKTVVVGVTPLMSEGRRRLTLARDAASDLHKKADAVLLFSNERISQVPEAQDDMRGGFSVLNQNVAQIVRGLAQLLRMPSIAEMTGDQLIEALGRYVCRKGDLENIWGGVGAWFEEGAGKDGILQALSSPLFLDGHGWRKADRLIAFVEGGASMPVSDYQRLMEQLRKELPVEMRVNSGVAINPSMQGRMQLTILAIRSGEDEVVSDEPKEESKLELTEDGVSAPPVAEETSESEAEVDPTTPVARISRKSHRQQKYFNEQVELPFDVKTLRGRFEKSDPTIHPNGENLDQPTFIRLGIKIRL